MARRVVVTECCVDHNGNLLGSAIKETDGMGEVEVAAVLTYSQICKKHHLTSTEFERITRRLRRTQLRDALFHWPNGPYYDILLHDVARCR